MTTAPVECLITALDQRERPRPWVQLVAVHPPSGLVLGSAELRLSQHHRYRGIAQLARVFVAPECRRRGVGLQLVQYALRVAQRIGEPSVWSGAALSDEPAVALLAAAGFTLQANRRMYSGDALFFIHEFDSSTPTHD